MSELEAKARKMIALADEIRDMYDWIEDKTFYNPDPIVEKAIDYEDIRFVYGALRFAEVLEKASKWILIECSIKNEKEIE